MKPFEARKAELGKLRRRGQLELDLMATLEKEAGFGAPEDDPTGIQLVRTGLAALEAYLLSTPAVPNKELHLGAHALVMIEEGVRRLGVAIP